MSNRKSRTHVEDRTIVDTSPMATFLATAKAVRAEEPTIADTPRAKAASTPAPVSKPSAPASPANGIEWADPPSISGRGRHKADYSALAAQLSGNPGRWAKVGAYELKWQASAKAVSLRKALGENFEVVQRGLEVFARATV